MLKLCNQNIMINSVESSLEINKNSTSKSFTINSQSYHFSHTYESIIYSMILFEIQFEESKLW